MTACDTTKLTARDLLKHLLSCNSRDEILAEITLWLSVNPAPRTEAEITARVDDALAGWYAAYGDPRPRAARRQEVMLLAERMIQEPCPPLGARVWALEWLETPNPNLGGRIPDELLDTQEEFEQLKALLLKAADAGNANAKKSE